eukprot:scaffold5102_cov76-Cyclotella_meneghiniana.AAC.11
MGSASSTHRRDNSHNYPATRNRRSSTRRPTSTVVTGSVSSAGSGGSSVPNGRIVSGSNNGSATTAAAISRPGAYSITRDGAGPTQVFRVQIPQSVRPGQEFQVIAGTRTVRVRCPLESRGGAYLQISVPPDPIARPNTQGMAVLTSVTGVEGGGAVPMTAEVMAVNERRNSVQSSTSSAAPPSAPPTTYMVTVPAGINPGMQFAVEIEGQRMMVTCPQNVQAGMNLRILPPPNIPSPPSTNGVSLDRPPEQQQQRFVPPTPPMMQMFEVVVPAGVRSNQPFSLIANGQRVLVTCPSNVRPGQKIRFQLPISNPHTNETPSVQLSYDSIKDGWTRTIRVTDMKFQWVRMDENGEIDLSTSARFDVKHSAYTRRLTFLEGNDPRMRTGKLELVSANESSVDSSVKRDGVEVVSYSEIADVHQKGYEEKVAWFQDICKNRLRIDWSDGHIRINVRRDYLLVDSIMAVMSLGRDDLRKIWRFEFLGEVGVDAGGLAREFYELVTSQIFDADTGLWMSNSTNQMAMRINPASEISCPEDHLIYFRFLGRIMGKAMFDGQLVRGHMVRHLYKHILGWPITFEDMELADEEYYNSMKSLLQVENVEDMCLDFTFTENALGVNRVVDLIDDGANVDVTIDNLPEFLESNLKYHLMERVKPQVTELLLGFYDVIPEPLLTIFDFQELELLMCGLPKIDIDDWMKNTKYDGNFEREKEKSKTCVWFWEIIRNELDQETRARLLQFVTGEYHSRIRLFKYSKGLLYLTCAIAVKGNDGNIRQFCINGVTKEYTLYPKSHAVNGPLFVPSTCFNRIDLPEYDSKDELRDKLKLAIATSATGFDIE